MKMSEFQRGYERFVHSTVFFVVMSTALLGLSGCKQYDIGTVVDLPIGQTLDLKDQVGGNYACTIRGVDGSEGKVTGVWSSPRGGNDATYQEWVEVTSSQCRAPLWASKYFLPDN
jgi:hypothetical protein